MISLRNLLVLLFICLLITISSAEPQTTAINFAYSRWINDEGSFLYLEEFDPDSGLITGHYVNKEEGYPCRDIRYELTGWIYGDIITFSVIWQSEEESCGALTTWIGQIEGNTISCNWQLINQDMEELTETFSGTDLFHLNME